MRRNQVEDPSLFRAIRKGEFERVRSLVNTCGISDGYFLLQTALEYKNPRIAKFLLLKGCEVNCYRRPYSDTPLHLAIRKGYTDIARMLIHRGADLDINNPNRTPPIFDAVFRDNLDITRLLINKGDNRGHNVELLKLAVQRRCREMIEIFLQLGTNVNMPSEFGKTPLHLATSVEIVNLLLSKGAHIDAQGDDGQTALHIATEKSRIEIVETLVKYGARIDLEDKREWTPLHIAIYKGYLKIVKIFLRLNADVNSVDYSGRTMLHMALTQKHEEIAILLLEHGSSRGFNINAQDKSYKSALHIATEEGYSKVVEALLTYGAEVDLKDIKKCTPLHIATQNNDLRSTEILLWFNANTDSIDENGRTPFHIALNSRHEKIVTLLLECEFDIDIDCYSCDPLGFFNTFGNHEFFIMHIVQQHLVKLKTANLYVSKKHLESIFHNEKMYNFQYQCEIEIQKMQNEKIGIGNVSLYDILGKSISQLAIYARNENIVMLSRSTNYENQFPIYGSLIINRLKKGIHRKELLENGCKSFYSSLHRFSELPYNCTDKILSQLSNEDLKIFIKALEPINVKCNNTK